MPKTSSASKIKLKSFNDLFGLNESMTESGDVINVMLDELFEFEGHPFMVRDDEKMEELTESIKQYGVLVPGIARLRAKGGYEIIAGHSRKMACKKAGLSVMPMIIRNMTDDEATIVMVDSNIQREKILPSEKARAYKMKYDAIKHQGVKGNSLKAMSEQAGESAKQIQRFIWIARLNDKLLSFVDDKKLPLRQAVDLSFLKSDEQEWVCNAFVKFGLQITIRQSAAIKELSMNKELDEHKVWEIIAPDTKPIKRNITLNAKKIDEYFADSYSETEIEEIIISLLDKWKQESEK